MAYKTFANGFPLPASDLNNYLMNQSVIVFADAAERTSVLTAPTEGMITYLEDTNTVEVYDGSAWTDINDNTAAIPKSTVTTAGDLIVADGASSVTRLGVGTSGQILTSDGTTATWDDAPASGIPATIFDAAGDLIYATAADSAARLARGSDGQILTSTGSSIQWSDPAGGANNWAVISSGSIPTGSGLVTFSGLSGYNHYMLIISGATSSSSAAGMNVRPNGDSLGSYGSYYYVDAGSGIRCLPLNNSLLRLGSVTSGQEIYATITFMDASSTSPTSFIAHGGSGSSASNNESRLSMGYHTKSNAALTSIDLGTGGNITGGTYKILGA